LQLFYDRLFAVLAEHADRDVARVAANVAERLATRGSQDGEVIEALQALEPLPWIASGGDYATTEIAGPDGIERRGDVWIGVSSLAPFAAYPRHRHAPEEVYLALSPGAYRQGAGEWFEPGIGGAFYNPPHEVHELRAGSAPMLAVWVLPLDGSA
jgi:hypothetical protein